MFFKYYGMRENPFGSTPDARYLFESRTHREALATLCYAIKSDVGFQALISPPGMGKTTLLFTVLQRFQTARTAFLFQTQCSSPELLRYLLSELGAPTGRRDIVGMHEKLNRLLVRECRAGRRVIVVIDEAQNLDTGVLESVRLLSDFETMSKKLLQIVLTGQPQLLDKLATPELTQLRQRISVLSKLTPLGTDEVESYIRHRLHVAGYEGSSLFQQQALRKITEYSLGIPRNINTLCFNALTLAYALQQNSVDSAVVEEAIADLNMDFIASDWCIAPPRLNSELNECTDDGERGADLQHPVPRLLSSARQGSTFIERAQRISVPLRVVGLVIVGILAAMIVGRQVDSRSRKAAGIESNPGVRIEALQEGPTQLTDVRVYSETGQTSITLVLDNAVKYAAGTLKSPERIYFDLEATQLGGMLHRKDNRVSIAVSDHLVRRIRALQRQDGVTRVVFDLRYPADYEVHTSPTASSLAIVMHARDTSAKPSVDLHSRMTSRLRPYSSASGITLRVAGSLP